MTKMASKFKIGDKVFVTSHNNKPQRAVIIHARFDTLINSWDYRVAIHGYEWINSQTRPDDLFITDAFECSLKKYYKKK